MDIAKQIGESPLRIQKANDKYELEKHVKTVFSNPKKLDSFTEDLLERKKTFKTKVDKLSRKLVNMGVDISEISKVSKSIAAQTRDNFKLTKLLDMMSEYINNTPFVKKLFDLGKSYGLLIAVFLMYSVIEALLMSFLPIKLSIMTTYITPIILAPLIEETAKYISIKKDFKESFFIVFNAAEWWLYIRRFMVHYKLGGITANELGIGMIIRFMCILTHGVFTLVHMENNVSLSYFTITLILHALHNTFSAILPLLAPLSPKVVEIVSILSIVGLPYIEKTLAAYMMNYMDAREDKSNQITDMSDTERSFSFGH